MASTYDGLAPIDVTASALPMPSSGSSGSSGGGWSTFLGGLGSGLGTLAVNYGASKLIDTQNQANPWAMPDQTALRYGYAGAYGVPATSAPGTSSGFSATTLIVLAVVGIVGFVLVKKALK